MLFLKKNIWFIFMSVFFVGGILIEVSIPNKKYEEIHRKFIAATINSRIRNIKTLSQGVSLIAFDKDTIEYQARFYAEDGLSNSTYDLVIFAEIGDSVSKESEAHSLYLYKKDKIFKYRIR